MSELAGNLAELQRRHAGLWEEIEAVWDRCRREKRDPGLRETSCLNRLSRQLWTLTRRIENLTDSQPLQIVMREEEG